MLGPRQLAALALLTASLFTLPGHNPLLAARALAQDAPPTELAIPDPAAVFLDPATTAFVVIDILQSNCPSNPRCVETLSPLAVGLATARAAGAHIVYSVHEAPDQDILPEVAPVLGDPLFVAIPGDKFFNSDLDSILIANGIKTVVLTGYSASSGVLYTAAAAIQRGYTVVVLGDCISAPTDLAAAVARWQLIHGPGANPDNEPLRANAVTMTQAALVSYQ